MFLLMMKILHLLKKKPTLTVREIIREHGKHHEVTEVRLYEGSTTFSDVISLIEGHDRVFTW